MGLYDAKGPGSTIWCHQRFSCLLMLRVAASVLYLLSLTCACSFPDRGQERELFLWVLADCDTAPHDRVMTPKQIVLAERQQYDYQVVVVKHIRKVLCPRAPALGLHIAWVVNPSKLAKQQVLRSGVSPVQNEVRQAATLPACCCFIACSC